MPTRTAKTPTALPVLTPNAAGIDGGATAVYGAVPQARAQDPLRGFATFTQDLDAVADWLQACGVQTVAMESTGGYWIPLCQILEGRGLEVCVVNSRPVKNVPGRKSAVADCQGLQDLHAVGLLRASLRPPQAVCAVRSLLRPRATLVPYAASHLQPRQKALTPMNLPLPPVISARTGKTGRASLAALRAGERDPSKLAQVRACRISASAETLARALVGDGREEPLFTLRQALSAYRHYQPLSAEWDQESERWLAQCASQVDPTPVPLPPATTAHRPPQRNEIPCHHTDLRTALYRLLGGALTQGPGCQTPTRARSSPPIPVNRSGSRRGTSPGWGFGC